MEKMEPSLLWYNAAGYSCRDIAGRIQEGLASHPQPVAFDLALAYAASFPLLQDERLSSLLVYTLRPKLPRHEDSDYNGAILVELCEKYTHTEFDIEYDANQEYIFGLSLSFNFTRGRHPQLTAEDEERFQGDPLEERLYVPHYPLAPWRDHFHEETRFLLPGHPDYARFVADNRSLFKI